MLLGRIDHAETYAALLGREVWKTALDWVRRNAATVADGITEIRGKDLFVNVHACPTLPEASCRFENHRLYADLHFCIQGGERIGWAPAEGLSADGGYDPAGDVEFFHAPARFAAVLLAPGDFAVFLPGEAHMPKLADSDHPEVRKLVVKIKRSLLA